MDITTSLGISRVVVREKYEKGESGDAELDSTLEKVKKELERKKITAMEYIRMSNMFLLWLHKKAGHIWETTGLLRATLKDVEEFIQSYSIGLVRLDRNYPSITSVINRGKMFELKTSKDTLSTSSISKVSSAMKFLQRAQKMIMKEDDGCSSLFQIDITTNIER